LGGNVFEEKEKMQEGAQKGFHYGKRVAEKRRGFPRFCKKRREGGHKNQRKRAIAKKVKSFERVTSTFWDTWKNATEAGAATKGKWVAPRMESSKKRHGKRRGKKKKNNKKTVKVGSRALTV